MISASDALGKRNSSRGRMKRDVSFVEPEPLDIKKITVTQKTIGA
jgi:hypothetical protein